MVYDEKIQYLYTDLNRRGIPKAIILPPEFCLLRKCGIEARPPHFQGILSLLLHFGATFAAIYGTISWIIRWRSESIPLGSAAMHLLYAGAIFGVLMAVYYRWQAKRLDLPSWDEYPIGTKQK